MKALRISAEALILLSFVVVPPALAGYTSSGGASLSVANTWLAAQTLPADGLKITDASGDILTVGAGTQSGNRQINFPTVSSTSTLLVGNNATANQTVSTGMIFGSNSLYVGGGSNLVNIRVNGSQSGLGIATFPSMGTQSPTIHCGFSLTTSAMTAGTVTISDSRFKTGDIIQCTRKSGTVGVSDGIESVVIVDGVSCTLTANNAADDGVYYVTDIKP